MASGVSSCWSHLENLPKIIPFKAFLSVGPFVQIQVDTDSSHASRNHMLPRSLHLELLKKWVDLDGLDGVRMRARGVPTTKDAPMNMSRNLTHLMFLISQYSEFGSKDI